MLLADMGARVIKVEQPGRGDDTRAWGPPFVGAESAYFLSINRNKESLTLDFKSAEGRRILGQLIGKADVVVENFRPGAMARLGLDYATLGPQHPRLVFCSISGFGQDGPRRDQPGYDAVIQAEGGLMSVTGDADGRAFRVGVAVTDMVAGLLAAQGIVLALFARERSGTRPAGRHQHVGRRHLAAELPRVDLSDDRRRVDAGRQSPRDDRAVRHVLGRRRRALPRCRE